MNTQIEQTRRELEDRKRALRAELDKLELDVGSSIQDIQDDVTDRINPRRWIEKHPLKALGVAVLIGFVAGNRDNVSRTGKITMTASVIAALKAYAARKAADQIVGFVEGIAREGKS
jgi:hypothetical protein